MGYLDNSDEEQMAQAELQDDSVFSGLLSQQQARADVMNTRKQQIATAKSATTPMLTDSAPSAKQALQMAGINPQDAGPGFVEGYLKAQDNRRAEAGSNRANKGVELAQGKFGIMNEQQSWAREAHAKEDVIQAGMAEAGKEGGYSGVIDYLKGTDPSRAMEFEKAKLGLDESIMKNSVMQAVVPTQQARAMVESYGALGKMGAAILSAAPEDRQDMYTAMQSMIKTVNPDAPASVEDAIPMFKLSMAQSMPEDILYKSKKQEISWKGEVGKALADFEQGKKVYAEGSSELKMLEQAAIDKSAEPMRKRAEVADTLLTKAVSTGAKGEDVLRKEWKASSKDFITVQDNYNKIVSVASPGPEGQRGARDLALIFNYMKILDPTSVVRESEFATAQNAAGIPESVRAQYNRQLKGGFLSDNLRKDFVTTAEKLYSAQKSTYETVKSTYQDIAGRRGYDVNNVIIDYSKSGSESTINQKADELIEKYKGDPKKVQVIEENRAKALGELKTDSFVKKYVGE
jgi:hypothetical protein